MKKVLSFVALAFMLFIPLSGVYAASEVNQDCSDSSDGTRTCTIYYTIDTEVATNTVNITLTEQGGASINSESITSVSGSEFTITKSSSSDGVYSVTVTSTDEISGGPHGLITYTYSKSTDADADCKVVVNVENNGSTITVEDTPSTTTTDTPTTNVQTGSTLPYIALGVIAVVAVCAYIGTKNKSKIYKI